MADDTNTASMTSPCTANTQFPARATFEDAHLPPAPNHCHKLPQNLVAAATVNSSMTILDDLAHQESAGLRLDNVSYDSSLERGIDSGTSTYDGDVSSAPGPASKRGPSKYLAHHQFHKADANDANRRSSVARSSLSQMSLAPDNSEAMDVMPPPVENANWSIPTSTKPTNPNHPPAPHGILSRLGPEELQSKMKDAIAESSSQRTVKPFQNSIVSRH